MFSEFFRRRLGEIWMFSTRYFLKLYRFGTMPYHAYDTTYLCCQQLFTARGMLFALFTLPLLRFSCFSHGFYLGRNCHTWNTPLIVRLFRSLKIGQSPLSKRVRHTVRSSASSFNFQYPVVYLSSSCLRFLLRLYISNVPSIFLLVVLVGID